MEHARPPGELVLEGGPASRADTWRRWLTQFQVFVKASGVHKEASDVQASLLINLLGPEGYDIYSTLKFSEDKDREDIKKLTCAFNEYFGTKPNVIMVRFKFFTRNQEIGESIDEYVTALKLLSQQCQFEQLEDSLVRDRIVCGVTDSAVRDRLLRTDDLTLYKAVKICQANEAGAAPRGTVFKVIARNQAEEDAFDYKANRNVPKPSGVIGSVAHLVKGALGGGILGGHVAYMKAGVYVALTMNILFGIYMAYCLYLLVHSAQLLYRRTHIPTMSYADVGEASCMCHPNPKVAKWAKCFRYSIDWIICIDLYGACACYQLIIAKSIKQLIEDTQVTSMDPLKEGYPSLRVYLAIFIIPVILICLITHLKYLAPFSIAANAVVGACIITAIYFCFAKTPTTFDKMVGATTLYQFFEFTGMCVFSMSCSGIVIPIENNMKDPTKFGLALSIGMFLIVICTFLISFFGYAAFLEQSDAPITINFPINTFTKILKLSIALMILVTHALNFWAPFNLCWYYMSNWHPPEKQLQWELIYRALIVLCIGIVAIIFPDINAVMGFIGAFCLTNMAFIWPNVINLLVIWERPGLGKYKWRLWRGIIFIGVGAFIFVCGTVVNGIEMVELFMKLFK